MSDPVVGVVLLNWNGYADTAATLDSLLAARPQPAFVVVVDNGSVDGSATRLAEWGRTRHVSTETADTAGAAVSAPDTWLRLILAGENRGFAGGNNIGLAHLASATSATHFLLLNNDALIETDYFARLADALRTVPDAGILGCTIYHHPETERVWFAGGYEDRPRGVALHLYDVPEGDEPFDTEWVTGCAMLISRTLYDKIGGLAECYFPIYCEDTDYSLRARASGARVMIAPRALVYHKVGGTVGVGEVVPRVAYWQMRHRVFYIRRNYSAAQRTRALAYLLVAKPARAAMHLARGRAAMSSAIVRGLFHGLRDNPS